MSIESRFNQIKEENKVIDWNIPQIVTSNDKLGRTILTNGYHTDLDFQGTIVNLGSTEKSSTNYVGHFSRNFPKGYYDVLPIDRELILKNK
jgi:hypothetical protein